MEPSKKIQQFLMSSLIPILCSVLVGFVFFPKDIFIPHMAAFQFVVTGIVASLFYNMMIFVESRRAYIGLLFLFMLQLALDGTLRPIIILRDIIYIGGIGIAIIIYVRYIKQNGRSRYFFSAVTLAGLYPLVYIVASEIQLLLVKTFSTDPRVLAETEGPYLLAPGTLLTVLIGFSVGVGITLSERFFGTFEVVEGEPAPNNNNDIHV
ncbi:MAG: hypothetical protein WAO19_10940 [Candidatus Kryptoniota bacterium]